MEYILLSLLVAVLVLLVVLLLRVRKTPRSSQLVDAMRHEMEQQITDLRQDTEIRMVKERQETQQQMGLLRREITESVKALGDGNLHAVSQLSDALSREQRNLKESIVHQNATLQHGIAAQNDQLREQTIAQLQQVEQRLQGMEKSVEERLEAVRGSMTAGLEAVRSAMLTGMDAMRTENSKKLEEIRGTVDEKLQTTLEKRIAESFKTVSDQLEQVYKGLGEMQTLAGDVGGLKKVLSGVKTRGILGEIQLGAILEEILSPEQYERNVATVPGSSERVEFAVRLPGPSGSAVYLPIDSKFPGDRYAQLVEAQESGDRAAVEAAFRALEQVIRAEAKDIRTKYVETPYTTNFGIMFLPFEGLYAEVANRGLLEVLQREYQVNIAGPSTMAALLNSLQMGFRTLAIQKRSGEVWELLGAVKTEFDKYEEVMLKMQKHLSMTSEDLENLMGRRANAIKRKLRAVQTLDEPKAAELLELED